MVKTLKPFVQGNTREGIQCEVVDPLDGEPVPCTGATVTFIANLDGVFKFSKLASISGDDSNIFTYAPNATDFDNIGLFDGEFQITFADLTEGRIQFKFPIIAKLLTA